jgi:uncharacterized protein (TIGR02217 family)
VAFIETQFPVGISYRSVGGPAFSTTVVGVESGQEYRAAGWGQALRRYEINHDARLPDITSQIVSLFMVAQGRLNGFRLKDWTDFAATSAEGIFVMLTSITFQAYKRYTFGAETHDRKIVKLATTPSVTGGSSPSWNLNTGVLTVASGTPTAWAGQFDVPVRFDTDELKPELISKSGGQFVVGFKSIPLVELRL